MARDDDFQANPGRIDPDPPKKLRRYAGEVAKAVNRAGGKASGKHRGFTGARMGRGSGVGRVLASRDHLAAFRSRRVIVKARLMKLKSGLKSAKQHLRYLQRDGVTREGTPGESYSAEQDRADGEAFLERCDGDRHQFRVMVSPDDGVEYPDLKGFTRRLMQQVEHDLGTKLDWVAVDHYNTGHPHSHITVRGRDDTGKDLIIARDYISHGMRERASEIATLDLGLRSNLDIENSLRAEMEEERFTSLDRRLQRDSDEHGLVRLGADPRDFFQAMRAGRLQKLRRLGLADEIAPGHWRLAPDFEPVLRRMGERGDIIKALHHELNRKGVSRPFSDYAIYDPTEPDPKRLVGRVLARGLVDELSDRHYLIIDGVDGLAHYVNIGRGELTEPTTEGSVLAITPKRSEVRIVDRTIAEVAGAQGGRYSIDLHLRHDSSATESFAETHVRRLEAMRRAKLVNREPDGSWIIAPDHLTRAATFEQRQVRMKPVMLETLSALRLERQITSDGATWLDRQLVSGHPSILRDAGFGRETREALIRRQQWLIEQDLARQEQDQVVYRANLLSILRRRDLTRAATQLSADLGLGYREVKAGERVEGIYRKHLDLASGRFALIERSRDFTLVPWRPVLERSVDKTVAGIMRGESISWTIGRQRGPTIS